MVRKLLLILFVAAVLGIGWYMLSGRFHDPQTQQTQQSATSMTVGFQKDRYSLNNLDSPWFIVNKRRPIEPRDYQPADRTTPDVPLRLSADSEQMQLRPEAARAAERLFNRAHDEPADKKVSLVLSSAFRPSSYQRTLYDGYVKKYGQQAADAQSARPGYSEHQTGLAFDIIAANNQCNLEVCFADTPEGRWLADNAWREGFVLRYGKGQTAITGYTYEPWHLRYVGYELAAELHKKGNPPLETFFDLPAAPNYAD